MGTFICGLLLAVELRRPSKINIIYVECRLHFMYDFKHVQHKFYTVHYMPIQFIIYLYTVCPSLNLFLNELLNIEWNIITFKGTQ